MADMPSITRRIFLKSTPAVVVAASLPVVAETVSANFTAIPTEAFDAIKNWQKRHRESVATANAYFDRLSRVKCFDDECRALNSAMHAAHQEVGPARERMIFALLKV